MTRCIGVALFAALLAFSLSDAAQIGTRVFATQSSDTVFEDAACPVALPEGQLEENVRCGYVLVPETRAGDGERTVRLAVAVLESTAEDPEPDPVFYLTGGPGAPALEGEFQGLGQAESASFVQSKRDFIFFDQRGTGFSGALNCPETEDIIIDDLANARTPAESSANLRVQQKACGARVAAMGVEFGGYSSAASAYDIADIADALGYDDYNLMGTSYGTRLALTAMRETPNRIRSAVLDSTLPLQVHAQSEIARNFESAFGVIVEACRNDTACNAAYPNFERDFYENVRKANEDPIEVTIRDRDDNPVELHLSGSILISGTFVALYNTSIARVLPFANDQIARGNVGVLQVLAQELVFVFSGFADAMTISVDCNEEVPFVTAAKLAEGNAGVRPEVIAADIGNISTEESRQGAVALCDEWGTPPPEPIEAQAVRSGIPALVLGGAHDPITPPEYGALASETLSKSYFFEFPSSGHGVFYHQYDCATGMIDEFITRPSSEPDASCIEDVAPIDFAIDAAPAPPPSPAPTPFAPPINGQIVAPDTGAGTPPYGRSAARAFVTLAAVGVAIVASGVRVRRGGV